MLQIFVGGSLRDVPQDPDLCNQFVAALGTEIVRQGHVLLNGCRSSLDQEIATAAHEWLTRNGGDPKAQIIGYRLKSDKPIHSLGTIRCSALLDWQLTHSDLTVPEQLEKADATIFVAGSEGTFAAKNWASIARKLILGIPRFGGSGETIYTQELKRLRETSSEIAKDYETLNSLSDDISDFANQVVHLAERLVTTGNVFIIMSFKKELDDVFVSCEEVCSQYKFKVDRTDISPSLERIVPRIELGIRNSAFVIADVSDLSPNVFYELGFAKALNKQVILTAKKKTKLPFDISDIPTIFWENQKDLKEGLRKCLDGLKARYGR